MKLMKHVRTGRTASFDPELIAGGNWVEVVEEKKAVTPKVRMPKVKFAASLDVAPAADTETKEQS